MGLITWIKDKYYNHRLSCADKLCSSNNFSEAEQIYKEILENLPEAAEHLAKMYYDIAISGKSELENLSKMKSLLARAPLGNDRLKSYHSKLVAHVENTAERAFLNKNYEKASRFLKAIEIDKRNNTDFTKKNRLYSLYNSLYEFEFDSSYYFSLSPIEAYCSDTDSEIESAILNTSKRLHKAKKLDRAYLLANCLAQKNNRDAIRICITIALDIYKQGTLSFKKVLNDKVILDYIKFENPSTLLDGLEPFVPYAAIYTNEYLKYGIESISNAPIAIRINQFKKVWECAPDASLIERFAHPSEAIAKEVIKYFVNYTASLTQKAAYINTLLKIIKSFEDYNYVLATLEKLSRNNIDVYSTYIAVAKKALKILNDNNEKIKLLDKCLILYNKDSWAIQEKYRIASLIEYAGDDKTAEQLYRELVGLHANAQPKLANLYLKQAKATCDIKERDLLLDKAFGFQKNHNINFDEKEYHKTYILLVSTVQEIIKYYFSYNNPDDAFVIMQRYKAYDDVIYTFYIKELKEYKDTDYVLSKLLSLKESGFDVKKDYIEIVNGLCKQEKIDNKYKQKLLAKTYEIYEDNDIYKRYINTSIVVIKETTEKEKAVVEFEKVWRNFQDTIFIDEFVNENYIFHKEITEFLVEWFAASKKPILIQKAFCNSILTFDNYIYALTILEKLHTYGLNVHTPYVAVIIKAISSLELEDKLTLINRGLSNYEDSTLYQEKYQIASILITNGHFNKAETILQELIGHHKDAEPSLAIIAYKNYQKAITLEEKEKYLVSCMTYNSAHSTLFDQENYNSIFAKALKSYIRIIDKHIQADNIKDAQRMCLSLKSYSTNWFEKYIKIEFEHLPQIRDSKNKAESIYSCFNTLLANNIDIKNLHSDIIINLWDTLFEAELVNTQDMTYEDSIRHLASFSSYIAERCFESNGKELIKRINSVLVSTHKNEGYKQETNGNLSSAISSYNSISSIGDVRTKTWAKIRIKICNIKNNTFIEEDEIRKILSYVGFAKEKKDLSYRYAIWLIKNKGAKNALEFIKEFLPNENELIDICNNEYIINAESALAELNTSIAKMATGELSLSEAKQLEAKIDDYDSIISPFLENVHSRIIGLKSSIQSYILSKSFAEGDFELAFKLLKDNGNNWYQDNTYFRNLAIACLGITENGLLNRLNYKEIISYWLTAVYRDQLFVQSLEYTSWDDSYTFTLKNSMGGSKEESFEALPDNVNFNDFNEDSVVSIYEVQQNLLNRFEAAIEHLDNLYKQFYDIQKDAMDSLVKLNLDHPCLIAAPYLANNTHKCISDIKNTLNYEYETYGNENILKVGIMYNIKSGFFGDYDNATVAIEECSKAIKSKSITQINRVFTKETIDSIQKFPNLYTSFVVNLQNILSDIIKSNIDYKTIISVFIPICQIANDNTLSYIFGNHIYQSIMEKLKDESLELSIGLNDMLSVYEVAKNCFRLKSGIGDVIEALIVKYVTEGKVSDLTTIKTALRKTGSEFEPNVEKTLTEQFAIVGVISGHIDRIKQLTSITVRTSSLRSRLSYINDKAEDISINMQLSQVIDQVNENKIAHYSALQKIYALYESHPYNKRVCDNLCTLVGMCIREYVIPDKVGKSTVMTVLNKLRNNKSTTYKTSAEVLINERQELLNSLPYEARNLLTGGSSYNSSLNTNGMRLKNALQLYLDLA